MDEIRGNKLIDGQKFVCEELRFDIRLIDEKIGKLAI